MAGLRGGSQQSRILLREIEELYEKAIPVYLEAIRLKADLAEARKYLAEAYAELAAEYREKAKAELEILKKLDPEEVEEVEKLMRKLDL